MNRLSLCGLAVLASAALLGHAGDASARRDDPHRCSVATLEDSYGCTVTGFLTAGSTPGPFAAVGRFTFDGAGNFQNVGTLSRSGSITLDARGTGTYVVNADRTGTLTFTDGGVVALNTHVVIDDDGDARRMIAPGLGAVLTVVDGCRQSASGCRR